MKAILPRIRPSGTSDSCRGRRLARRHSGGRKGAGTQASGQRHKGIRFCVQIEAWPLIRGDVVDHLQSGRELFCGTHGDPSHLQDSALPGAGARRRATPRRSYSRRLSVLSRSSRFAARRGVFACQRFPCPNRRALAGNESSRCFDGAERPSSRLCARSIIGAKRDAARIHATGMAGGMAGPVFLCGRARPLCASSQPRLRHRTELVFRGAERQEFAARRPPPPRLRGHPSKWKGDDSLYRPLLFVWLAFANWLFSYHHAWWNAANVGLHGLVVLCLFRLLLTIRSSRFAFGAALLFLVMSPSMELVVWHHLGGYLLACTSS